MAADLAVAFEERRVAEDALVFLLLRLPTAPGLAADRFDAVFFLADTLARLGVLRLTVAFLRVVFFVFATTIIHVSGSAAQAREHVVTLCQTKRSDKTNPGV